MQYSVYSHYYDRLNKNHDYWFEFIDKALKDTDYKTMIEYGCGTGNILSRFADKYSVSGVDLSEDMLDQAKAKIKNGNFYLDDMVTFNSGKKNDIALCLFDSLNHVLDFSRWSIFFKTVSSRLNSNGMFILDINTIERLNNIVKRPAGITIFDQNYFSMDLKKKGAKNFIFDVRILDRIDDKLFREEKEEIEETAESGSDVYRLLKKYFISVTVYNEKHKLIGEDKFSENERYRWFFICR